GGGVESAAGSFDAWAPGFCSHGNPCSPTSAISPPATRTANRKVRKLDLRSPVRALVTVVSPSRTGFTGRGSVICGRGASATVGSLRLPPRGIAFHPLLATHAFSSDSTNSWHERKRASGFFESPFRSVLSIGPPRLGFRRCGAGGSSVTIL